MTAMGGSARASSDDKAGPLLWRTADRPATSTTISRIRTAAVDEFGPPRNPPRNGLGWAVFGHPERHLVTYCRTRDVRCFHGGCYSLDDTLR
ncbi:hypothetical protein [Streptomyces sp. NPDC087215]|uniref:hypothetical protein n=1 Tax=Streptomyces sp. NPDC087215 TaxID=3365767 RepID=UPI0037FB02AE